MPTTLRISLLPPTLPTETDAPNATITRPAPPPADDFGRVAAAESTARFGTSRAKLPDLMNDWRAATVDAAVEEAARATFWPEVEQALQDAFAVHGELTRRQMHMIVNTIEAQRMPAAIPLVEAGIRKDEQKAIDDSLAAYRPIVDQKKDPFMPLALGDPAARAKERVLWENGRVMILVDAFGDKPKALVVPKTPASFPVDVSKTLLGELAKIAAETSAAFAQVHGCKDAEIWVNPPQYLSVKQLHVHVGPPLAEWDETLDDAAMEKTQNTFWAGISAVLGQRLQHHR